MIAEKTRKSKKRLTALPGEYHKAIVVPNNVANAKYSYTLLQERIFNYVLFYLQCYTKQIINGVPIQQLQIFTQPNDSIDIIMPMSYIAAPSYYKLIREAAKELANVPVCLPMKKEHKSFERFRSLFNYIDVPTDRQRSNMLTLQISKDVARMLMNVDKKMGEYTSFLLEVTLAAKNKYTPRIYKFISSWKNRGGKDISVEEMRDMLQLGDMYQDHNSFMRRVLIPVQQDLDRIGSDCWFEVSTRTEGGKKVVGYTFKIISEVRSLHYVKLKEGAINMLRTHFNFKQEHIKRLQTIIEVIDNYEPLIQKIWELHDRGIMTDKTKIHKQDYVIRSIIAHFAKA
jgi:Initiator Replication protein